MSWSPSLPKYSVTGAEVDLIFKDARTNALYLREIPQLHTRESDSHLGGCVESFEPPGERLIPLLVNVAADLDPQRLP